MEETLALIPFLPFFFFPSHPHPTHPPKESKRYLPCFQALSSSSTPQTCLFQLTCHLTSALPILASITHPFASGTPFH